jgi:hypothetical protein
MRDNSTIMDIIKSMVTQEPADATAKKELEKTRNALIDFQRALQQLYGKRAPGMMIYGSKRANKRHLRPI